ncbi:MAG: type II toxin-antitoxin system death-on-curing family toxin [Chloroflexi bacterium]|nr:type II toxin-antitoxin system death-on-curing family toxin [Chloroflexota bacterium]
MTAEFYPGYPDPLPAFQYIGGDYGRGLLESALAAPQHAVGGTYLARTIFDKTALLFRSLVKNHAMVDGNKRLALTTATVFLYLNGYVLTAATQDAIEFTLGVAAGPANPDVIPISR